LYINYLPEVKDKKLAERLLKENLPLCKITFKDEKELIK